MIWIYYIIARKIKLAHFRGPVITMSLYHMCNMHTVHFHNNDSNGGGGGGDGDAAAAAAATQTTTTHQIYPYMRWIYLPHFILYFFVINTENILWNRTIKSNNTAYTLTHSFAVAKCMQVLHFEEEKNEMLGKIAGKRFRCRHTELLWLRIGTNGGLYVTRWWTLSCIKYREFLSYATH